MKKENTFLLYAIVVFTGFLLITNFFIPITYAINDDTTMKAIAAGTISGVPDGHLIFVKYSLGVIIAFLYKILGGIDWYGCTMLGIILICVLLFAVRVKRLFKNNYVYGILSLLAVFIIVIFENYVSFQFTVVSAIAAATAIFYYNTIDSKKEICWTEYIIVIILALISFCVRYETFIMALPFAGISFLFKDVKWKEKIIVGLLLLFGLGAITITENLAYASSDWQNYREYTKIRSRVYDYHGIPNYEKNKDFYDWLGMNEYDVENLQSYNLYLVEDVEDGIIQKIADYNAEKHEEKTIVQQTKEVLRKLIKGYFLNSSVLINGLAKIILIANIWFEIRNKRKTVWANILFFCLDIVLIFYLACQGRMVERVTTALFMIEFYSVLSIWCEEHQDKIERLLKNKLSKIILCGMIVLSTFMIFDVYNNQKSQYNKNLEWEELQSFFAENSSNIYFVNAFDICRYTDNFNIFEKNSLKNYIKLGEWSSFSPVEQAELNRNEIMEVDEAIIQNENIYLIFERPSEALTNHYLEKYESVEWIVVDEVRVNGKNMSVYKLQGEKNDKL